MLDNPRLQRELTTVTAMIGIHCRGKHGRRGELCPACRKLVAYARRRLENCPYGAEKPTCARCPIHCYRPATRQRIRSVMRYAGPRMAYRHPVLAVRHVLDGLRSVPEHPSRESAA